VRTESLPAYYQAPPSAPIQVPGATEARIGLTLPIGDNHTNLYLGLGDSITAGDGSSDGLGYKLKLQNLLGPHFGRRKSRRAGAKGTPAPRRRRSRGGPSGSTTPPTP